MCMSTAHGAPPWPRTSGSAAHLWGTRRTRSAAVGVIGTTLAQIASRQANKQTHKQTNKRTHKQHHSFPKVKVPNCKGRAVIGLYSGGNSPGRITARVTDQLPPESQTNHRPRVGGGRGGGKPGLRAKKPGFRDMTGGAVGDADGGAGRRSSACRPVPTATPTATKARPFTRPGAGLPRRGRH